MDEAESIEEIMRRVRRLEIRARRLAQEVFSGDYHSSFRGQGLDFDEFREYQPGDEIRFIDWNVTARMETPFIRKFREERELSVILAVDISGSTEYGSDILASANAPPKLQRSLGLVLGITVIKSGFFFLRKSQFSTYLRGKEDAPCSEQ